MLKPVLKASIILAISLATFTTNQTLALSKPAVDNNLIEQSILMDPWTPFQQGFNTFLQLDSAMTKPFFGNPTNFNRFVIQENPKQFLISLDLPGVDPRKIKVSVSQGILFVQARENNGDKAKQNEHNQYYFSYHIALPDNADTKKMSAILKRGVLQISIEKTNKLTAMTEIPVKEIA